MLNLSSLRVTRAMNLMLASALVGGGGVVEFCCEIDFVPLFCLREGGEGLFSPSVTLTLSDLGSKTLPFEQDPDDDDRKDMAIVRFPYDKTNKQDKWLLMRARRDGASATHRYAREFQGAFTSSLKVALEDDAFGLVDGVSTAWFGIDGLGPGTEGAATTLRLEATWDAAGDGVVISAHDEAGPLGAPVLLPATRQLFVEMAWEQTGRSLTVSGDSEADIFFYMDDLPPPKESYRVSMGARGLERKARVFFDELMLQLLNGSSGAGEATPAVLASIAFDGAIRAELEAQGFDGFLEPDPEKATMTLEAVLPYLEAAEQALENAQDGVGPNGEEGDVDFTLHPTTQTKLASRALRQGVKRTGKGIKLGTKLAAKDSTKTKSLQRRIARVAERALLVRAQLFGFKSKSLGRYFKTLTVTDNLVVF